MPHLPEELIEKILLNLPLKSLLRFSTASKLWNSIIFRPKFMQSYRGREIIVFKSLCHKSLACPLSSISSDNPSDETTPFEFPPGSFLASCGNLWCCKFEKSLLLYNPSIQIYRKFPNPKMYTDPIDGYIYPVYVYGLGYDSASDDYKVLKICKTSRYVEREIKTDIKTEIYSLTSDCWREVESQPPQFNYFLSRQGLLVSGKLHWLVTRDLDHIENGERIENNLSISILSFDLSEDKFGLIELPDLLLKRDIMYESQVFDMIVFGGKLRVYRRCTSSENRDCKFSIWVMEDYESELWIQEMEFGYGHVIELCNTCLSPFYFYDDAGNLVRAVTNFFEREKIFIYKGGSFSTPAVFVEKNFSNGRLWGSLTYVESLFNPLTCHRRSASNSTSAPETLKAWNSMKTDDDDDEGEGDDHEDDHNDDDDDDDDDLMMMVEALGKWRSYKLSSYS